MERYDLRKRGVEVMMKLGRLECRTVIGTRCEGIVLLGVGSWRIARTRDRGPWVAGVSIRNVRAVSMGARMRAESDDEIKDRTNVIKGEDAVKMSAVMEEDMSSSGKPTIAERRLRMNVFKVGRRREYINVALEAFQGEEGPLEDHSWERTSVREFEFLRVNSCAGFAADSGRM
jgi:hypothetical protein